MQTIGRLDDAACASHLVACAQAVGRSLIVIVLVALLFSSLVMLAPLFSLSSKLSFVKAAQAEMCDWAMTAAYS